MCFGKSGILVDSEDEASEKKSRKGKVKSKSRKKVGTPHKTHSLLEQVPTQKLPGKALEIKVKEVDEDDTLHGFEHSMSERLFEADPEKETSEQERRMIMGRPPKSKE
ncbi:unnamed protein product [Bursaphelenchus okinawaensis]|uniref:Uncharacterized protein n=1 Tax=Bursaphelenchus okinawaensis TaxID=465554 RepID=A0A811KWR1_9BILA|nr:unnamed protein product [Bursaphelenchus okinawaensis]CAG9112442.1 unnamed protein product [Bursaphelenchus okinawaensis]